MSRYYIKSGSAIEELAVGDKLGSGAIANEFAVIAPPRFADSAAKIYLDPRTIDAEKIGTLVEKVPAQLWAVLASGAHYPQYAWPQHVVYGKSAFGRGLQPVGLLMPKVDPLEAVALDAYFDPSSGRMRGLDGHRLALPRKVAIAINLCKLLGELHSRQVYWIDFKPQNVLANRNSGIVTLLDCDSYSVVSGNGNYYPATPPAKGHAAPEVLKNEGVSAGLAEAQDCFALALGLFQIFNYGVSPFSGTISKGWLEAADDDARVAAGYYPYGLYPNPAINPLPRSVHDCLPVSLREMFDRAFREGAGRPTAREWEEVLRGLREKARYVTCKEHANDPEHIHFAGLPCCRCERDRRIATPEDAGSSRQPPDIATDIASPKSEPVAQTAPQAPVLKAVSGSRRWHVWMVWAVAVALAVALLTFLGGRGGDSPTTHVRTPPQSPPASQAPGESSGGGTGVSINPAMPPAGGSERKPFTREQIYYCLAKEYRKDAIGDILSRTKTPAPASFFADIADYNVRCRNYTFSNPDFEAAKSTFEDNKASILDEATAEAESFRINALVSTSPGTDDAGDQGVRPDRAGEAAGRKPETARPRQPEPAKTQGAPVVSGQREKPPAASVLPAAPGADKSTGSDSQDRGKATARPQEPDPAVVDRAPVVAPRQEKALTSTLLTAIQRGDRSTVNEYLNRGTSPNEILPNGASALKNAVVSSHPSVAQLLLSRGADVNARDATGKTALFWARRMNNQAMVQVLLNHGAQD
jgi:serine/threonine protein kinase